MHLDRAVLSFRGCSVVVLAVPQIQFTRGTIICLHLPEGCNYPADDLNAQLLQIAERNSKRAIIAQLARQLFAAQTSAEWLAAATSLSIEESTQTIDGFAITVAPTLSRNAGTPRCCLGAAAALMHYPDVVVYTTAGLDPSGCKQIHQYIASHIRAVCAVHLSYRAVFGNGSPAPRYCPDNAKCLTLRESGTTTYDA